MLKNRAELYQIFTLSDGRKLGFAEFGDKNGKPVFYFHGYIGGRLEAYIPELFNNRIECRLISIDRPGIGLSDFQENRTLLDWPPDVLELADHLGLDKFSILGVSGGGPYVAACAYKIADRLDAATILAGMGPYKHVKKMLKNPNRVLFGAISRIPFLWKLYIWVIKRQFFKIKNVEKFKKKLQKANVKRLPKPDAEVYKDTGFIEFLIEHMKDVLQQHSVGVIHDGKIIVKKWGFELEDIPEDLKIFLWHGELDKNVDIEIGKYVSSKISNCETKFLPNEAHISIVVNHFEDIIESIL